MKKNVLGLSLFPLLGVVFLSLLGVTEIATAQMMLPTGNGGDAAVKLEDPETKADVREMVSQLSDDSVRALLIQRLDAVAEAKEAANENTGPSGSEIIAKGFGTLWRNAKWAFIKNEYIGQTVSTARTILQKALEPGGFSRLLLILLGAIIAGLCAERLVAFLLRKRKQRLIDSYSTTLWGILKILYSRLAFDVLGVVAFWLVSYLFLKYFYDGNQLALQAGYIPLALITAAGMGFVVARFYFAPTRPDLRICKTTDQRAMRLTISYSLIAGFIVFMHNCFYMFLMIGIENYGGWDHFGPLGFFMNISLYLSTAGVIWYNRAGLTEILFENKKRIFSAIGDEAPVEQSWFATHWPKIAVLLIAAKYLLVEIVINSTDVGVYSTTAVYVTFIVIFLWPGIDAMVSLWVGKGIKVAEDEGVAAGKARRAMQQGLLRVGRVLVVGVVLYALAWFWGLNLLGLAEAGLGAKIAGRVVEVLLIALVAYMLWELVSIFVSSWMAKEGDHSDDTGADVGGGDAGGVGLSRTATLLPILRGTAKFLIVTVSIVMVLNNWGVNIGPLLAGAGVIGLAIGFGAQTLVKDIVSGLFFLVDDAFRVGEYIDVGGTMGNVEKISLRSLRLRHHRGLVHTIPYGEIPKLTNFSRDWVIMKLRFRVPVDCDVAQVKKIFKKIGQDLLADPLLGEDFLQPFKSQGVAEVDDNGIVVRGKFMAKPGKQFMIRKEVYVRVQKAFDEAGIPFARKQVMVTIEGGGNPADLSEADKKAIGAAAQEASEEMLEGEAKK
jgi:small-conductance mechanosensitive channel